MLSLPNSLALEHWRYSFYQLHCNTPGIPQHNQLVTICTFGEIFCYFCARFQEPIAVHIRGGRNKRNMEQKWIHSLVVGHCCAGIAVELQHDRTAAVGQKPLMRRWAAPPLNHTSKMNLVPLGHSHRVGNL